MTNMSVEFLKWRYLDVPIREYVAIGDEESGQLRGLVIARIKESTLGKELRITECFLKWGEFSKSFLLKWKNFSKTNDIDYCTMSGHHRKAERQLVGAPSWTSSLGPAVTIRPLVKNELYFLDNFNSWSPSIGDLELF